MVLSASQNGPLNTDYFTSSAGITYAGKFSWGNLSGQYARELGFGSVTGQSGTIQGQNYSIGAQHGRSSGFRIDGTLHGSDQTVRNALPVENHSFTAEASIADRIAGDFSARIGGGWQWGSFLNAANEFRSDGYTARAGIEHPRLQVSASINDTGSNSLPFYGQLLGNIGLGSVIVTPLRVIPSDYRAMSLTVHSNPLRKVEFSALWTRSRQHLDTLLSNDFELLNVFITYHFRRVQMEAGFIRSNQIFASYPDTLRKRLYIRFLRNARIL